MASGSERFRPMYAAAPRAVQLASSEMTWQSKSLVICWVARHRAENSMGDHCSVVHRTRTAWGIIAVSCTERELHGEPNVSIPRVDHCSALHQTALLSSKCMHGSTITSGTCLMQRTWYETTNLVRKQRTWYEISCVGEAAGLLPARIWCHRIQARGRFRLAQRM